MIEFEIAPQEYEIKVNWYDAKLYCFTLTIDGKTGWRLPTVEELKLFYAQENDLKGWYWSADEYDDDRAYDAIFLTVLTAEYSPENKYYDGNIVRPVRYLL